VFTAVIAVSSVTAQPRTIRLGLLTSMTGPAAATGEDQRRAVALAIEEINAAGGVFVKAFKSKLNLELFVGDDQTSREGAVSAVTKLIVEDKRTFSSTRSFYGVINPFSPYAGTMPAIKAFAVVILGSLGSVAGAVLGGLLYGIVESFATFFLGGAWRDAVAFVPLILVLLIRPEGIFKGTG
jgi:branched-chain amino acid transport system permease protein